MKVLLAVGGGIAAYKSAELARLLMRAAFSFLAAEQIIRAQNTTDVR